MIGILVILGLAHHKRQARHVRDIAIVVPSLVGAAVKHFLAPRVRLRRLSPSGSTMTQTAAALLPLRPASCRVSSKLGTPITADNTRVGASTQR